MRRRAPVLAATLVVLVIVLAVVGKAGAGIVGAGVRGAGAAAVTDEAVPAPAPLSKAGVTVLRLDREYEVLPSGLVQAHVDVTFAVGSDDDDGGGRGRREAGAAGAVVSTAYFVLPSYEAERLVTISPARELDAFDFGRKEPLSSDEPLGNGADDSSSSSTARRGLRLRKVTGQERAEWASQTALPACCALYAVERASSSSSSSATSATAPLITEASRGRVRVAFVYVLARALELVPSSSSSSSQRTDRGANSLPQLPQYYRFGLPSAYAQSPYTVREQRTRASAVRPRGAGVKRVGAPRAPPAAATTFGDAANPSEARGARLLTAGPYVDTPPWSGLRSEPPLSVAYEATVPANGAEIALSSLALAGTFRALHACRTYEISHWGNLGVLEELCIRNDYPPASEAWSRLDFLQAQQGKSLAGLMSQHALVDMAALVPKAARGIYFCDVTGNISSSTFLPASWMLRRMQSVGIGIPGRGDNEEEASDGGAMAPYRHLLRRAEKVQVLGLRPRFPLAPGWSTRFKYGYNVRLHEYSKLRRLPRSSGFGGSAHAFNFSLPTPMYGLHTDELEVRVVLPPGGRVLRVDMPDEPSHYTIETRRDAGSGDRATYRYLDQSPRTVLVLKRRNVPTDMMLHTLGDVRVVYAAGTVGALLSKPLGVIAALGALFAALSLIARLDVSLSGRRERAIKARGAHAEAAIASALGRLQHAVMRADALLERGGGGGSDTERTREWRRIEAAMEEATRALAGAGAPALLTKEAEVLVNAVRTRREMEDKLGRRAADENGGISSSGGGSSHGGGRDMLRERSVRARREYERALAVLDDADAAH